MAKTTSPRSPVGPRAESGDGRNEGDGRNPADGVVEASTMVGIVMQEPVNTSERKPKMKVMVAVDDSEGSFYALRWMPDHMVRRSSPAPAADYDNDDEVGMITLVHVQQPLHHYAGPSGTAFFALSVAEMVRKAQEENSAIILSRALHMCIESMVKAETLILVGDPKDMICQATERMHVDRLVVGSHGHGKDEKVMMIISQEETLWMCRCKHSVGLSNRDGFLLYYWLSNDSVAEAVVFR